MAPLNCLKLLFTLGSLVFPSAAVPPRRRNVAYNDDTPLPLVIWHGLGDNYANPGLRDVGDLAEAINPGTLVHIIKVAESASEDSSASWLGNVTDQVSRVCDELATHPILSTAPAIDALGFSQGGQFLRAYVERCNKPPVRSLVTFGAQHNGITDFRTCGANDWLCKGAMALLRGNTWSSWVQSRLVPAQYYRNPADAGDYERYLEHSNFLADINNERVLKNGTYKKNLASLENLVLYLFADDTTVIPKETAWFEEVNGTEITPLRARQMYKEDWLGLRELDLNGGIKFRTTPGDHMQLDEQVLNETFKDFFGPLSRSKKASWFGSDL